MSEGITIRAEVPRFDAVRFSRAVDTELKRLYVECARAFLIAAVRRIQVRTGFLRGAFGTLADAIGAAETTQRKALLKQRRFQTLRRQLTTRFTRQAIRAGRDPRAAAQEALRRTRESLNKLAEREMAQGPTTATRKTRQRIMETLRRRQERILELARVRGSFSRQGTRYTGANTPGKFNLRTGERVRQIFNRPGFPDKLEYYYHRRNDPDGRVLKTTRSGRQFTRPATKSILTTDKGKSSAIPDLNFHSRYTFTYSVDIRYLAINDVREGWRSWSSAIDAFNYHLSTNLVRRFPDLLQHFRKDVIIL